MKSKQFNKKLRLNKKTIADLGSDGMNKIHGGYDYTALTHCNPVTYCVGCPTLPPKKSCDVVSVCICPIPLTEFC